MQLTFTPAVDYFTVCLSSNKEYVASAALSRLRALSFFTRNHSGFWGLCGLVLQLSRHHDVCDGVRGILGRLSPSDGVR
jgi:hypothetical protein